VPMGASSLPDGCVSATHSDLSDVLPAGVCLRAELTVGGGGESVSTWAEVVGDSAERDQETLCVLRRLEPLEYPLANQAPTQTQVAATNGLHI
jgi:hypothetical protein